MIIRLAAAAAIVAASLSYSPFLLSVAAATGEPAGVSSDHAAAVGSSIVEREAGSGGGRGKGGKNKGGKGRGGRDDAPGHT